MLEVNVVGGDGQGLVEIIIPLDAAPFKHSIDQFLFFFVGVEFAPLLEKFLLVEGDVFLGFLLFLAGDVATTFWNFLDLLTRCARVGESDRRSPE